MQKSDVVQLIGRLPKGDRRALRKFLQPGMHNTREEVHQLYLLIDKQLNKKPEMLHKERAFAQLFPGATYDDQLMRHAMSYLLKAVETYLIFQEASRNEITEKILLLTAYRKLRMEKHFQRTLRMVRKKLDQSHTQDTRYFQQCFQVEQEIYLQNERKKRDMQRDLGEMVEWMDIAYLTQKLRQSCRQSAHQAVYKVEYDQRLLQQLLVFLEQSDLLDYPAISLYFYYLKAVQAPHEKQWFDQLKMGFMAHQAKFSKREQQELLQLAINFTIRQFNTGEAHYLRDTFELYRLGLELELLLEDGYLSRFAFKNIAGIAIRLQEYAWTEQFIERFAAKLPMLHRTTYVDYCLAKLRFAQGHYQQALQRLQAVAYDDLFLNLDTKVLQLKIYVELDEEELLDALLTSFKRFIERKKGMGYHRKTYLNTIYFTRKIMELNPFDRSAQALLAQKIEAEPALAEREWLLEKLRRE
ncbi:MAG: hypothetical protein AAF798_20160 [Bacteroidota bacterium]